MKRRWNLPIWAGFLLTVVALISYRTFFIRFPITRDFPWANLLLFAAGLYLLGVGLKHAFGQPQLYRGKISGAVLGALGVLGLGYFLYATFHFARQLPASEAAPRVGQKAPDFTLVDKDGNSVTLSRLLASSSDPGARGLQQKTNGVLLIFYRGYW